jgi:hypothetical protein
MSLPKTIQHLVDDPRIQSVDDERDTGDGYWIYLEPGHQDGESYLHLIHEWTVKDLLRKVRGIEACRCEDCVAWNKRQAHLESKRQELILELLPHSSLDARDLGKCSLEDLYQLSAVDTRWCDSQEETSNALVAEYEALGHRPG